MHLTKFFEKSIILTGIFSLVLFTGCDNDLLNTVPKDRLSTETYWETEKDARLAVNALYNDLPGVYTLVWDSMSDIAIPNNSFFTEKEFQRGTNDALNGVGAGHWNQGYAGIRAANEFLANVDQVETDNQELINQFKAEARTIRAFEYLQLIMVFGDIPFMTEPISIEESKTIESTDKEQIWDFIEKELQESAADLPVSYSSEDQGRITRGAALALKARAMLYAGRYTEAYEAAKAVMDLGVYSLYPSYENLFTYGAENNEEVILNKQYVRDLKANNIFARFGLSALGQSAEVISYPVPTKDIIDAYEMSNGMAIDEPGSGYDPTNPYEDRDPRLDYSIFVLGDSLLDGKIYDPRSGGLNDVSRGQATTNTGFDVQKYVNWEDRPDPYNSGINVILIRYAEVLLTYAEAKIEAGAIDQSVYDAINEVRQRPDVNMPAITTGKSQDELRQIVRHERMVELAFEGQRFFDIRRWKTAEDVMQGPILGARFVQDNFAERSGWSISDVDSENASFPATNVLDGDESTFWHTEYLGGASQYPHPHRITIDMGGTSTIYGFKLTGRLDDNDRGNPRDILIEVSSDGTNWGNGESFTLNNVDVNTIHFSSPQQARFFRITINSSFQDTDFTHLAEIEASIGQDTETVVYPDYERSFTAPKHYLWAIPTKELELNPNLTQNPGY